MLPTRQPILVLLVGNSELVRGVPAGSMRGTTFSIRAGYAGCGVKKGGTSILD
jgi:hypothetical protein